MTNIEELLERADDTLNGWTDNRILARLVRDLAAALRSASAEVDEYFEEGREIVKERDQLRAELQKLQAWAQTTKDPRVVLETVPLVEHLKVSEENARLRAENARLEHELSTYTDPEAEALREENARLKDKVDVLMAQRNDALDGLNDEMKSCREAEKLLDELSSYVTWVAERHIDDHEARWLVKKLRARKEPA